MRKLTAEVDVRTLEAPGATSHYEVRGAGPVLLCMPGGPAVARAFARIAGELAPHYTVVTYDPRGLSRSPLTGPFDDQRAIEINADDAHRLIAAVTPEK